MPTETSHLQAAAAHLRENGHNDPVLVLVLGSGLKGFASQLEDVRAVPFGDVPGWPSPEVEGHGGSLVFGTVERVPVACLTGRVHLYEGWTPVEVVRAVRTLRVLGAQRFLLTNAAGGIRDGFKPGDLMVLRDHINLTGSSPLVGMHEAALGPRFPDQTDVYTKSLRKQLITLDRTLLKGVYAGLLGPSYETPSEVRMLRRLGADAVGMSTVHEGIALNAMGADVAAISLITNLAAGISEVPLDHEEVLEAGRSAEARLTALVRALCALQLETE